VIRIANGMRIAKLPTSEEYAPVFFRATLKKCFYKKAPVN